MMAADPNTLAPAQPAAPPSWDPVNRPPVDDASRARMRTGKRVLLALTIGTVYVHIASRTPAGQPWILLPGILANLGVDIWALVYALRRHKSAPTPEIVPRTEMKWNLAQAGMIMVLFAELFRTEAGRQVIFALLLVWVPVCMLVFLVMIFKGIYLAIRNRKSE